MKAVAEVVPDDQQHVIKLPKNDSLDQKEKEIAALSALPKDQLVTQLYALKKQVAAVQRQLATGSTRPIDPDLNEFLSTKWKGLVLSVVLANGVEMIGTISKVEPSFIKLQDGPIILRSSIVTIDKAQRKVE